MNYNPFEKPFATGKLAAVSGGSGTEFNFVLDNPLEEGIYLFEIVENDLPDRLDDYVYTGIFKVYDSNSQSSEFYGEAGNYQIGFWGDFSLPEKDLKVLHVTLLNNYNIDLSSFSCGKIKSLSLLLNSLSVKSLTS